MARTKGAWGYGPEVEEYALNCINNDAQSTLDITKSMKSKFEKIHPNTVERLLNNLKSQGKIKGYIVGRVKIWQK